LPLLLKAKLIIFKVLLLFALILLLRRSQNCIIIRQWLSSSVNSKLYIFFKKYFTDIEKTPTQAREKQIRGMQVFQKYRGGYGAGRRWDRSERINILARVTMAPQVKRQQLF
jgi:hypothetical protein